MESKVNSFMTEVTLFLETILHIFMVNYLAFDIIFIACMVLVFLF